MPQRHDPEGVAPPLAHFAQLLQACRCPEGHYDELREASSDLRPQWAVFADRAGVAGRDEFARARRRLDDQLRENGVTYNVHGDGGSRAWSLDVLPHIVSADDWAPLAAGLRQRARLLELVLTDLYGSQRLLEDGLIPPALVLHHPGFLRQVHGIKPASRRFLHVVAFDVARVSDGAWRVFDVRVQAPSGSGYALENRLSISQLYPDAFQDQRVCLLAPYFRALRESLLESAPCDSGTPHIALLTPGPYSETYVEQTYLARYLGFTLVEGADLTVRDDRVYLKTVSGLQRVHAILRRLDDDYSDPLELRAESTIGVPGLVQAWRSGNVLLANALGTGVIESPALQPSLPALCQQLLGEPLALQSVATAWGPDYAWPGDADAAFAQDVIKPAFPDSGGETRIGARLSREERHEWVARLRAEPDRFVLEEYVPLSHAPVWGPGGFESRALMMRVFLVADGRGDYTVMNGGLTRVAGSGDDLVSSQRGGGSKDTWVLSDRPIDRVTLLPGRLRPEDIVGRERMVSSRAAEHLFWMGRYAERSENSARLLRAVLTRLHYGDPVVSARSQPIVRTCAAHGLLGRTAEHEPRAWEPHTFEQTLMQGIVDRESFQSVAFNVDQTVRAAGAVRDRLSTDNWRELNRLSEMLRRTTRVGGLAVALDMLDRVIMSLVAVGGLEMAHMTRDAGWRFLSLGRHLERVSYVTATVGEVARSDSLDDPSLLEWLLDLSDGIITYRARYMGRAEWLAVVDLLLFDPSNPRSAVFQLAKLAKHVPLLPDADTMTLGPALEALAATRTAVGTDDTPVAGSDPLRAFVASSEQVARHVCDALTLRYFSHAYEASHSLL